VPVHIRAEAGDVAEVVLLPGDPGRAKRVAKQIDGARCYNENRGLLGYTGSYRGAPVSVQTTGMGAPSAAIAVEELAMLGAKTVIRIGTCGGATPDVAAGDLVIATASCPLDGTTRRYAHGDAYAPAASYSVVSALVSAALLSGARHHVGLIATDDVLYADNSGWTDAWSARGVLAQEMEASAVFTVAALRGLRAGCVLVVANNVGEHDRVADGELQPSIDAMIGVALEAAVTLVA